MKALRLPAGFTTPAADKQATAAANGRVVEQNLESGRKLGELRDATPNNVEFGRVVRRQFDLHNSAEVAAMIRVWKR